MRITPLRGAALAATLVCTPARTQTAATQPSATELRAPSSFDTIADRAARSRALFSETAKVLTSPRCMNCHPAGDHPTQGDDRHPHDPPVERGAAGDGVPGATCQACHLSRTVDLFPGAVASYQSIPGHPRWQLAPLEMAWQGKSIGEICRQLKDKTRNGGRDLAMLHEHAAKDDLVAYGWQPARAAFRRRARRRAPVSWCRRGSIRARSVREAVWWAPGAGTTGALFSFACNPPPSVLWLKF